MTTKRIGVYQCTLEMSSDGYELWSRPLSSNYYVFKEEKLVAYVGSGPKNHFYVSIFFPKGGGSHYSFTTEHSDIGATFDQILEMVG